MGQYSLIHHTEHINLLYLIELKNSVDLIIGNEQSNLPDKVVVLVALFEFKRPVVKVVTALVEVVVFVADVNVLLTIVVIILVVLVESK